MSFGIIDIANEIAILGFGKEGKSSYHFIRSHYPDKKIIVLDRNENLLDSLMSFNDPVLDWRIGPNYADQLDRFDLVLKTPGIRLEKPGLHIKSQTELFISKYKSQTIGITGTKGKSSMASLTYAMLEAAGKKVVLGGNIGIPAFELIPKIDADTLIVLELSCHQLFQISTSPKYAVLLNLFEEHLDYYKNVDEYYGSKLNLAKYQTAEDYFIFNMDDQEILARISENISSDLRPCSYHKGFTTGQKYYVKNDLLFELSTEKELTALEIIPFFEFPHHVQNSLMILELMGLLHLSWQDFSKGLQKFEGLAHRLQIFRIEGSLRFVNDSISTIPQACIAALDTLKDVKVLILGGMDRGIDLSPLIDYLQKNPPPTIICMGQTGKLLFQELQGLESKLLFSDDIDEIAKLSIKHSKSKGTILFSPAAASYIQYRNFEARGDAFMEAIDRALAS